LTFEDRAANRQLMREARVGLSIVGILFCIFVYIAFKRISGGFDEPPPEILAQIERNAATDTRPLNDDGKSIDSAMANAKDSVTDPTLVDWIASQVQATPPEAGQICFQVREEHALQYTKPLKALLTKLGNLGFTGAIEHFGIGRNSAQLLEQLPVEFVKIDGAILQNIETNPEQQERVRLLVEAARACNVETIAERVEQASTMAVLFQLGLGYMQGHYVYEPEVVLAESRG